MNKSELIDAIATKNPSISKKAIGEVVDSFVGVVSDTLAKGESLTLVGFGTFEARKRAARNGHNPKTGEAIKIEASVVPGFKAGAGLKKAVGGK